VATAAPESASRAAVAPEDEAGIADSRAVTPEGAVHAVGVVADLSAQYETTQLPAAGTDTEGVVCVAVAESIALASTPTGSLVLAPEYADSVNAAFAVAENVTETDEPASPAVAVREYTFEDIADAFAFVPSNVHPAGVVAVCAPFTVSTNTIASPACTPDGTVTAAVVPDVVVFDADARKATDGPDPAVGAAVPEALAVAPRLSVTVTETGTLPAEAYTWLTEDAVVLCV
jgi:hypothetical protein